MNAEIHYDGVRGLEAHHLELLRTQESAVRSVLERSGHSGHYRWIQVSDDLGNQALDLVEFSGPQRPRRVARITPLEFTLTAGEFERALWEGRAMLDQ